MKKLLLGGALFVAFTFTSGSSLDTKVFYCNNKSTQVYHLTKECRGIKRCTHEIKGATKVYATGNLKLTLCGYED
jgi:hypothetical protein